MCESEYENGLCRSGCSICKRVSSDNAQYTVKMVRTAQGLTERLVFFFKCLSYDGLHSFLEIYLSNMFGFKIYVLFFGCV